jgi:hypothetical protein
VVEAPVFTASTDEVEEVVGGGGCDVMTDAAAEGTGGASGGADSNTAASSPRLPLDVPAFPPAPLPRLMRAHALHLQLLRSHPCPLLGTLNP